MAGFDRILIALELGGDDSSTLAFANRLIRAHRPKRIDLVHVMDTRMVPDAILEKYGNWLRPAKRRRTERLEEAVTAKLELEEGTEVTKHILSGAPVARILETSALQGTSLIITGRSPHGNRIATLPIRVARRANCSVLVVPRGSRDRLQRILIPIDFSERSAYAVEVAAELTRGHSSPQLRGLHAFALPPGARRSGTSEKKLIQLVRKYAERVFEEFRAGLGDPTVLLEMECVFDLYPSHAVLEAAQPGRCDLVVLGVRASSVGGAEQLGRVAARVLHESNVPVLVTRRYYETSRPAGQEAAQFDAAAG